MLAKPKTKKVAVLLAFLSVITPISGLHKFYLKQPVWGIFYLLLGFTPIPKIASIIEGIWYLTQDQQEFDTNFNAGQVLQPASTPATAAVDPVQVSAIADALRQLDTLRQDGLISEYEFEQKRRQLLDRIG
ncbi:NINE protein [Oscillatoria sp. FACHB-1407]|uniref:NINE protein n=1 Tax=Oscillatoria sp. FACHB-1407 TaxID=2692847 RepID=UPI00168750AD|nr:NINE protein [Oscillatoria sp. FACHB-1407]MBD2461667.1 NINE protein [Oscillatoria sp. FACHB-1407]